MVELLKIGASVPTLLGILGMALVVALFVYYLRLRSEEVKLRQIPRDQRAQAFDTYLTRYKIETSNLNPQQIYELIRLELEKANVASDVVDHCRGHGIHDVFHHPGLYADRLSPSRRDQFTWRPDSNFRKGWRIKPCPQCSPR